MIDREVVKEFLEKKASDWAIEIPNDINFDELVETFCLYTEDDYYEWLKDNAKSFFTVGQDGIDWDTVKKRIKRYLEK
ncbi:MAG: hypothetical protein QME58_05815 [Bacteroidota bacterium]|nr:hypothetical protein [Bacteroidota bacterium]